MLTHADTPKPAMIATMDFRIEALPYPEAISRFEGGKDRPRRRPSSGKPDMGGLSGEAAWRPSYARRALA